MLITVESTRPMSEASIEMYGKMQNLGIPKSKVLTSGSRWKNLNQFGGVFTVGDRSMRRHDDL